MEPRTKAPPQRFTPLAPSVCLKRHVTARRPTEKKKKDQTGTLSTNNPSFFCTLWVLNDDGVKERER